jgi:uncharacterized protein (DUF4415 family)
MRTQPGDRVRLKDAEHLGMRGTIKRVSRSHLTIELADGNEVVQLPHSKVTNYSLAARKAWTSMPNKRVGRPRGSRVCDRTSVTLRIDRDLWDEFRALESDKLIKNRTTLINAILREKIAAMKSERLAPHG